MKNPGSVLLLTRRTPRHLYGTWRKRLRPMKSCVAPRSLSSVPFDKPLAEHLKTKKTLDISGSNFLLFVLYSSSRSTTVIDGYFFISVFLKIRILLRSPTTLQLRNPSTSEFRSKCCDHTQLTTNTGQTKAQEAVDIHTPHPTPHTTTYGTS